MLKYVVPGELPLVRQFHGTREATLAGFTPAILTFFPGADLVRECVRRFLEREGVLCRLMDPRGGIAQQLQREFEGLPDFLPRERGGLLMPRDEVLARIRLDRFRLPDGIACGLGVAALVESVLRQAALSRGWGGARNARGGELVERTEGSGLLRPATVDHLRVVFDQRSLSLRDAMAHAAFFADDTAQVEVTVAGLTRTMALLVEDFDRGGVIGNLQASPRWDEGHALAPEHLARIDEPYGPGLNIVDQLQDDEARAHVFRVLDGATPDKRLLGTAAFLLWISGQRDEHAGGPTDDAQQFAALFGGLLTLEELLRGLYETDNQPVLRVTPGGNGMVRCHLAMLDDRAGELLEQARLEHLFRHYGIGAECLSSFSAARAVRDLAFHGAWQALSPPWARYTHLVVKLLFTLCSIAHFRSTTSAGGQQSGGHPLR